MCEEKCEIREAAVTEFRAARTNMAVEEVEKTVRLSGEKFAHLLS
jgi:hypothetical protein